MTNIAYAIVLDSYNNIFIAGHEDLVSGSSILVIKYSQLTSIDNENNIVCGSYYLTNFPNPFNPETNILYEIPESGVIKIVVYDNSGREIEVLKNLYESKGSYKIIFNGKNYSSGIYFYTLIFNGKIVKTNKMILIK